MMSKHRHELSEDGERWLSERLIRDVDNYLVGDSDDDFVFAPLERRSLTTLCEGSRCSWAFLGVGVGVLAAALIIAVGLVFIQSLPEEDRVVEVINLEKVDDIETEEVDVDWTADRLYALGFEKVNSLSNHILTETIVPIAYLPEALLNGKGLSNKNALLMDSEVGELGSDATCRQNNGKNNGSSKTSLETEDIIRASWSVGTLVLALERCYEE